MEGNEVEKKHGALFGGKGKESFIYGSFPRSSYERRKRKETERRETKSEEKKDEKEIKKIKEIREIREIKEIREMNIRNANRMPINLYYIYNKKSFKIYLIDRPPKYI